MIGPVVEGAVTGERYKWILHVFQLPKLAIYSSDVTFQQDGASPRYTNTVRQYLGQNLPNRRMGREGSFLWPFRPSDFTQSEVSLLGHIEN